MDGNNWMPNQGEPTMDAADWRSHLMPESRPRIVNKIMDALKKHLPISGPEGLVELRKIAIRFEERIYAGATSQSDYLRKIALKMLTMETKSQGNVANSVPSNPGGNQNPQPPDPASMDSTVQTGHAGVVDWQEEVYQKIKSMKELYLPELNELYQTIAMKLQQHDALIQQPKLSEQIEKLTFFRSMLERMITFLQVPKSSISPSYKEKLSQYEKQIIGVINSNRLKKPVLPQQPGQQQLQQSVVQSHSMPHQPQSQMTQIQQHDNLVNSMQPMNMQGSLTSMQLAAVTNLQHGSMPLSTHWGVPASQLNMMNALQTGSSLDSAPGPTLSSLSQGAVGSMQQGAVGSLQQNTINTPQQTNISTLSQNSMNQLLSNINSLQANSDMIQQQHLKQQQQEQQLIQSQQLKQQYMQRLILQMMQQQQQQQQLQQQKLQQSSQLQPQQMSQLHQMTEVNELKVRQGAGFMPGLFLQSYPAGQCSTAYHQQLKPGTSFPISSPQLLHAASPQISQHSSPWIDHQNVLSALPKAGTPLQSANFPFLGTSPSTPVAPSPILGDLEQQTSAVSSISNAGSIGHQQTSYGLTHAQSLAIGAPGISASPLLGEFSSLDGNQGSATTTIKFVSFLVGITIMLWVLFF